jgi:hypothetical protein
MSEDVTYEYARNYLRERAFGRGWVLLGESAHTMLDLRLGGWTAEDLEMFADRLDDCHQTAWDRFLGPLMDYLQDVFNVPYMTSDPDDMPF